ncbi:MaoC domain-containing protein dehydratase [Natrialba chahannaoensis JCM 10990]|uniref:MaoC domain-containing protein dehydratase n=1 Tax=Natrialba chahannaoensis JCM 10990 TaxID=1227492 RepID=M0AXV7_9EURY|nr:MaoC family dehydratase [Natrialba chahannaoensis]ELZ03152.1 MaoC domain-containing protein dehydratase [Natrialba chahannaoensis JCM 10990]
MSNDYYEDFSVGETYEFGEHTLTEDEIISYGEQYDPLPFHTDPDAATESVFGGLIASGLLTVSVAQRLFVENLLQGSKTSGALGVDELRWKQPVRPGDTLHVTCEVTGKDELEDGFGIVRFQLEIGNQSGSTVASLSTPVRYMRKHTT